MVSTLYVEESVREHPRAQRILSRFANAEVVWCDQYSEVFNPRAQSFRLQKRDPALILARKHARQVMPAPPAYGVGGDASYYFSHMLNCVYDCRYCFLQGMYRSAHYLLFVNYEDFTDAIEERLPGAGDDQQVWFFSGYDCDSLAFDPITGFVDYFVPWFRRHDRAWLELRTKSTQIRALLKTEPIDNVVVAFSFTPQLISRALEHGVPDLRRRLVAMQKLQKAGWSIGLRFDPLIFVDGYQALYAELIDRVMSSLDPNRVHSVSLGSFRMPKGFHKTISRLYPDEPLYAMPVETGNDGTVSYPADARMEMLEYVSALLLEWICPSKFFNHESTAQDADSIPTQLAT